MSKKKMSSRELVLLVVFGVLILGFCFYKFFYLNIMDQIEDYRNNAQYERNQTAVYADRVRQVNAMREAVNAAKSDADFRPLSKYDNSKPVIKELNKILNNTESFSLTFSGINTYEYVYFRPVSISFSSESYQAAREIIKELNESEYFSQISNVSMSLADGSYDSNGELTQGCNVSMNITYFEVDG